MADATPPSTSVFVPADGRRTCPAFAGQSVGVASPTAGPGSAALLRSARMVLAVRPANWNDSDDPDSVAAWTVLEQALKPASEDENADPPCPEAEPTFLGHLIETNGEALFIPRGQPIPLLSGRGAAQPVYSGPQNVTAALSAPTPSGGVEREALARIVDPTTAELLDELTRPAGLAGRDRPPQKLVEEATAAAARRWSVALARADAILALSSPPCGEVVSLLEEARDLLMERRYGNNARSPGHNARLVIEQAILALSSPPCVRPARAAEKMAHVLRGILSRGRAIDAEAVERALTLATHEQDPSDDDRRWASEQAASVASPLCGEVEARAIYLRDNLNGVWPTVENMARIGIEVCKAKGENYTTEARDRARIDFIREVCDRWLAVTPPRTEGGDHADG